MRNIRFLLCESGISLLDITMKQGAVILIYLLFTLLPTVPGQTDTVTNIRLVEPSLRVEVMVNGEWGTICDDDFDVRDGAVICRMLELNIDNVRVGTVSSENVGTGPILIDNLNCDGSEDSLNQCAHAGFGITDCSHKEDATVNCTAAAVIGPTPAPQPTLPTTRQTLPPRICDNPDPNLRLRVLGDVVTDGGIGLVEYRHQGQWGNICDNAWGQQDARVVCNMLCFNPSFAKPIMTSIFGNASFPFVLDEIDCLGLESTIENCPNNGWRVNECHPTEAAAVSCLEEILPEPVVPKPVIQCEGEQIIARFSRILEPRLIEDFLSLTNGDCEFDRVFLSSDSTAIVYAIPYNGCGTDKFNNLTHIIYRNYIHYDVPSADLIITRSNVYDVEVQCIIRREQTPEQDVQALPNTVPPYIGDGQFNVRMTLYLDSSFNNPITTFPAKVMLGSWMYVVLTLVTNDIDLKLVVPECKATPTADPESQPQIMLIEDKCRQEDTVRFYPLNETTFGLSFQTFQFREPDQDELYVHCRAYVCEKTEHTSQCDRSCIVNTNNRRRRDVPDISILDIEKGPLVFYSLSRNDGSSFSVNQEVIRDNLSASARITEGSTVILSIIVCFLTSHLLQ